MKIVGAQMNVVIGDLRANAEKVKSLIRENLVEREAAMVVFPELTLTGYPPSDLLLQRGFVDDQLRYADEIRDFTKNFPDKNVVLGLATINNDLGKPLRNSLVVYRNGEEIMRYHKQLLPTYDVFDENRYFEPGPICDEGQNVLTIDGVDVGFIICEDAWNNEVARPLYGVDPVAEAANQNIGLLVTINASPSHIGKYNERIEMYQGIAKRHGIGVFYLNQVGAHDSLIFDGGSFAINSDGEIVAFSGKYQEDILYYDDARDVSFAMPPYNKYRELFDHLTLGIRDYVHKNGFKSIVVGSSGGIDSAVVLALAVAALGKENVFAITMPSKFSSAGSVDDSDALCQNLGVKLFHRSIAEEVELSIRNFTKSFGVAPSRLTIENEQARIRGRILMEYSNHFGALVLSTGNKSEMSVGYATIYGDMCGGLAVIADCYKMEVYGLAKWMNDNVFTNGVGAGPEYYGIPAAIIDKAPSAELWEGQKDTDSLPPYPILDALLKLYIEREQLTAVEIAENQELVKDLSMNQIEKYLLMTDRAEFKRQQAPPILKVHKRAFGAGRVLPITQKYCPSYKNIL